MTVYLEPRQVAVIEGIADRLNVSTDHFMRYLINRVLIHPADGAFGEEDLAAPDDAAGAKDGAPGDGSRSGASLETGAATSANPDGTRRRPSEKTLQLLRRVVSKMDAAEPERAPHDQAHADTEADSQPSMFDLADRSGPGQSNGESSGA